MTPLDPRERDLVKCEDIRIHAERAIEFLGSRTLAQFQTEELVQAAVIRCLEVIGEAARQISRETRQRATSIPWSLIVGMRNILAHDYGSVDIERVFSVASESLPSLVAEVRQLTQALEQDVSWSDDEEDDSP